MHYGRPDKPHVVTLWQRAAPDKADGSWQPRTVGDQTVEVDGGPDTFDRARLVRDGTEIVIRGQLRPEKLLWVLVSVIPASTEPPLFPPE